MKRHFLIAGIIMMIQSLAFAQTGTQRRLLKSASSPKGNYIYLFGKDELAGKDSAVIANTAYFIIERVLYELNPSATQKKEYDRTVEARRVQSGKELQAYFSKENINEIKKLYGLKTDDELAKYFNTHNSPAQFPIIYDFIETKQALGQVFLDKNVKAGEVYMYNITRVSTNNTKESWGYTMKQSMAGNYLLLHYKPLVSAMYTTDSMVSISWKMVVPENSIDAIPVPKSIIEADVSGALVRMPFGMLNTRATVFIKAKGQFAETGKLMPVLNKNQDTLTYTYTKKCRPEEEVTAYLVTEDEVYNEGISSDTAFAYAISDKIVPLIYGIRVKDIQNAVQLSWNKLPRKPYIVGIEIRRTNSEDVEDSLTIVPATDTSYTDYQIAVGQHYRYKVKVVFLPLLNVAQKVPAEGIGTYTVFSRPLPPFNLEAATVKKNIQLNWEAVDDPSLYGYYIYRGTSSKNLELVAGPVFTKGFLDTSGSLSGRNAYYYAVQAQNLRQDTSILSPVVSIVPERAITTVVPNSVDFYFANNVLNISWNDIRKGDNDIAGFIVQKKTTAQKNFALITASPVTTNFTEDSLIIPGIDYEYRVAAISIKGDTSEYGNPGIFTLPKNDIMLVKLFYLRNVTEGINISWPQVEMNRKAYNIYRREASQTAFTKTATVNAKTFSYVDKDVKPEAIYVYYLTITEKDDREGDKGKSISIRRTKK